VESGKNVKATAAVPPKELKLPMEAAAARPTTTEAAAVPAALVTPRTAALNAALASLDAAEAAAPLTKYTRDVKQAIKAAAAGAPGSRRLMPPRLVSEMKPSMFYGVQTKSQLARLQKLNPKLHAAFLNLERENDGKVSGKSLKAVRGVSLPHVLATANHPPAYLSVLPS
jgi:hypothetical protein